MEAVGRSFIDAFNRRDVRALIELCDSQIAFYPTVLVGTLREYRGHEGIRCWMSELESAEAAHRVRVREFRELGGSRFLLLTEVLLGDELVSPSAMLARLGTEGLIVEARAYLSDEHTLVQVGLIADRADTSQPSSRAHSR